MTAELPLNAYFMRCRPQHCDVIELVYRHHRVFVGYPAWRSDGVWDKGDLSRSLFDLALPDDVWDPKKIDADSNYRRGVSKNRGFARKIEPGDMVVIPRREEKVWHLAKIAGRFEFVPQPPWGDEYLALRQRQGLSIANEPSHLGDVVYTWPVAELMDVPVSMVPRWVVQKLRRPVQIGQISDSAETGESAFAVLNALYRKRV